MAKEANKSWFPRVGIVCMALALMTPAFGAAWRGHLFYESFWGGPVFVPIALLVGPFLLYLAIFRWERLRDFGQRSGKQKH